MRAQAASVGDFPPCLPLFLSEGGRIEREREASSASAFVEQVQEFPRESLPPFAGHGDDARNHLSLVPWLTLEGGRYPSSFVAADLAVAAAVYPATPPRSPNPGLNEK